MKKKSLFLLTIVALSLSLSSCGSKSETTDTLEQQSEQSVTIEPTETLDSTSESVVYSSPTPTSTPTPTDTSNPTVTPDPTESNAEDFLTDQMRQDLETLGATEDEINSIKTEKDMVDLINKLISNDRSSSTTNNNSGEKSEGNSEFDVAPEDRMPTTGVDMTNAPAGSM